MRIVPCSRCGYHAPQPECPHCGGGAREPSLDGPGPGLAMALLDGLRAVPMGLLLLLRTRGVKRFLLPPMLMTALVFVLGFAWAWGWMNELIDAARLGDVDSLPLDEGWLRDAAAWLIDRGVVLMLARAGSWLVFLVASSLVGLYTFSIVYEAIAGPFLDEIQGRLEERWYGANPRNAIQRPTRIPVRRCVVLSSLGALPALGLCFAWWKLSGLGAWLAFLALPLPWIALGVWEREYGVWLRWVAKVEGHTLWVSVKASLLAALILVLFLPLKLVPLVGYPLFVAIAGFSTAITLLDIPFSRRQWTLAQRLSFLLRHGPAATAFGVVASVFFLVPIVGPLFLVPGASVGGLWLVCRVDKSGMRPKAGPPALPPAP